MSIGILVVDDNADMRAVIADLIELEDDMHVAAEADDERTALAAVASVAPDVALIDLTLKSGGNGVDLVRLIKAEHPNVRCILFSAHDDAQLRKMTELAGADGFLNKMRLPEDLPDTVRHTAGSVS